MEIIIANDSHLEAIWEIFHSVAKLGDTYVFDPNISRDEALAYWNAEDTNTYVAVEDGRVYGTYILKANQPGLGSHVANASYMVSSEARGAGVGSSMCLHSIEEARRLGYLAIQFNLVVSTNTAAISLWKKHGFEIVGELPNAFNHKELGYVDALIMYRSL